MVSQLYDGRKERGFDTVVYITAQLAKLAYQHAWPTLFSAASDTAAAH